MQDAIRLEGAEFCIGQEYFEWAEEMLIQLSPTASASSGATA
jgi:hypothetical protein